MVQQELRKRRTAGKQHCGVNVFSGKLFCGCCGGQYGSKVWHSNSKYRRVIWQCNAKFKGQEKCDTPHLTEDEIQQLFVEAINELLKDREFIFEDTKAIMEQLTATEELEAEAAELRNEMEVTAGLLRQAIAQNASIAIDQAEYNRRYEGLTARYETVSQRLNAIQDECAARKDKRSRIAAFMKELNQIGMPVTEFSEEMWIALVERVEIQRDGTAVFTFKNGSTVNVK